MTVVWISIVNLISALKDDTTFKAAKHTQTMATAKAAIQTSKDSLHECVLKRITNPISEY